MGPLHDREDDALAHLSPDVKRDAVQQLDRRSYSNLTATEPVLAVNTARVDSSPLI